MPSTSDRYTRVKKPKEPKKVEGEAGHKEKDPEEERLEKFRKRLILISCLLAQVTCGSLYLNMASFFPVYANNKFNPAASNSELTPGEDQEDEHAAVISTLEISFCIVAFELACLIASPIHAKTISLMGRKNAILIGFAVQLTCCVLLGFAAYFPADYPVSFLWFVIVVRMIQGYGDSLSLCCGYSVINLTFTDDRAEKIGMMEAAFGFGCIIGPSIGSLVFGAVGYEWTMYYFALQTLAFMLLQCYFLPDSLNHVADEEDDALVHDGPSEEEQKLLEGYNLLKSEDVGLLTVLCDPMCFLAYFATFMGMFAMEFFVSYLSLHLEKQFLFKKSQMGFMFSISAATYLPMCVLMPYMFKTTPPRLVLFLSYIPTTIGMALMGPSALLGIPNKWEIVALGLGLTGAAVAPSFILCLPEVHKSCQLKYKIVEKSSESLDGKLSDQEASLYSLFYAFAALTGPVIGSAIYDRFSLPANWKEIKAEHDGEIPANFLDDNAGYRGSLDVFLIVYALVTIVFLVCYSGFTPYADFAKQNEELENLNNLGEQLAEIRAKEKGEEKIEEMGDTSTTGEKTLQME